MHGRGQLGRRAGRCGPASGEMPRGRRHRRPGTADADVLQPGLARARAAAGGRRGLFAGKVERRSTASASSPSRTTAARRRRLDEGGRGEDFAGALIPVYPAAPAIADLEDRDLRRVALDVLDPPRRPAAGRRCGPGTSWSASTTALRGMHRPARPRARWRGADAAEVGRGVRRCSSLLAQRRRGRGRAARRRPARPGRRLLAAFDARLPFELTGGQREVGGRRWPELAAAHPMHRLLQGEVGSGKTVVALRAMLQVVDAGGQAALLAPDRGAGRPARPLDRGDCSARWPRPASSAAPSTATRVALLTGSHAGRRRAPGAARGRLR